MWYWLKIIIIKGTINFKWKSLGPGAGIILYTKTALEEKFSWIEN